MCQSDGGGGGDGGRAALHTYIPILNGNGWMVGWLVGCSDGGGLCVLVCESSSVDSHEGWIIVGPNRSPVGNICCEAEGGWRRRWWRDVDRKTVMVHTYISFSLSMFSTESFTDSLPKWHRLSPIGKCGAVRLLLQFMRNEKWLWKVDGNSRWTTGWWGGGGIAASDGHRKWTRVQFKYEANDYVSAICPRCWFHLQMHLFKTKSHWWLCREREVQPTLISWDVPRKLERPWAINSA